jgi:hypothetical protein
MKAAQRRTVLGIALVGAFALMAYAYYLSLSPATHPDHDHGILNLDAGGRLVVETRGGKSRNLVGKPGHVLVLHFFSTSVPDAASELRGLFTLQETMKADKDVELVLIARETTFEAIDSFLAKNELKPPVAESIVLDTTGDATSKLNSKRPLETMFFGADGKLASQARGRLDWEIAAIGHIQGARGGATIE